jgi:hypothetical protein
MALLCGQIYAFGGYEKDLKERMNWHQTEVRDEGS